MHFGGVGFGFVVVSLVCLPNFATVSKIWL